ncbi:MAG: hypothetical protein Q8K55_07765 [Gemmatimonadaceae bacterium]|nr:hypothetical protein [Gemmatimonadaceae bacterium]
MSARRGFALAAVLAAMVIMAMVVAISAQRALVAARQAGLDLARAELAAAVSSAQVAALEAPVDSALGAGILPGAPIAGGEANAGRASARWQLVGAAAPYATIDVEAEMPVYGGTARIWHRVLVAPVGDSAGGLRWAPAAGLGWTRVPSR